jgi:hypothetical protein
LAYKDQRVISILLEQADEIEERCDGYRDELREAVADIVNEERQNKYSRTNIAVKVADIVGRVGTYLNQCAPNGGDEK